MNSFYNWMQLKEGSNQPDQVIIGKVKLKIERRDSEFIVKWIENNRWNEDKSYFTNDKQDAIDTMNDMAMREGQRQQALSAQVVPQASRLQNPTGIKEAFGDDTGTINMEVPNGKLSGHKSLPISLKPKFDVGANVKKIPFIAPHNSGWSRLIHDVIVDVEQFAIKQGVKFPNLNVKIVNFSKFEPAFDSNVSDQLTGDPIKGRGKTYGYEMELSYGPHNTPIVYGITINGEIERWSD